ncbi:putative pal1 cell morphology protein [Golovinomyces cichoracearum]|uniref:Putative pal1 cell morphology protein n=1 Tax=Golovinomyces cichoracearum TaxID=62708 RepID=A0A420H988_9PEZI|nr:putative pal1 cell morphology protein [Golovinomyces cichoracearum]
MMSLAQPGDTGGNLSNIEPPSNHFHKITASNLSSNNPFRNRAVSPISPKFSRKLLSSDQPSSSISRNPFFDTLLPEPSASPSLLKMPSASEVLKPLNQIKNDNSTLLEKMSLDNKSDLSGSPEKKREKPKSHPAKTSKSSSPQAKPRDIVSSRAIGHRFEKSQEDASRTRRSGAGSSSGKSNAPGGQDLFSGSLKTSVNSPKKIEQRRARRNSDSSTFERSNKSLDPEEEKKRQERRSRDRKPREHSEKDSKPRKPNRKLDVIDKLDVTSIYGTGLFHHDGPFDACNPHRNRQGSKRAPMQAFPKDSLNNVLGGGGPINIRPDHALFLGNKNEEAFNDYSKGGTSFNDTDSYDNSLNFTGNSRQESNVLSATNRVEPIHGEETLGLGTSTFLEGAPASRNAMQRRESETVQVDLTLSRSKSIAQKFRGINVPRRDINSRITIPDNLMSPEIRTPGSGKNERGTGIFFDESRRSEDTMAHTKKENIVTIAEPERNSIPTQSGKIPRHLSPLDHHLHHDGSGEIMTGKTGIGFMSRVKSLKGGPRKMKANPIES